MPLTDLTAYGEYTEPENRTYRPQGAITPSPIFRVHEADPVHWHTWGQEAFTLAMTHDMPVFLSIQCITEHWCHVMNRECFSDTEVAEMLNATCINIILDMDEYPEVYRKYQALCVKQNGSSGLPLNIFMTPEGHAFFCTTWLPKRAIGAVPGFTDIIPRIRWLWHVQRNDVYRTSRELNTPEQRVKRHMKLTHHKALEALRRTWRTWDTQKLPLRELLFLAGLKDTDAHMMLDRTLRQLWRSPTHDHLGGGYFSSQGQKLLRDNALMLYIASCMENSTFTRLVAEDIAQALTEGFTYAQAFRTGTGDMTGKYYLWTEDEITALLGEWSSLFMSAYGALPAGNMRAGMNMNELYEASSVGSLSSGYGLHAGDVVSRLDECRKILHTSRHMRTGLIMDDKLTMSTNGIAIAALAQASETFTHPEWRELAEKTALWVMKTLKDYRVWTEGSAYIPQIYDDYACFLWGIMELLKRTDGQKQKDDYVKNAQVLAEKIIAIDPAINEYSEAYAISARMMTELGIILHEKKYTDYARKIIDTYSAQANITPLDYLTLITSATHWKSAKPKPEEKPKPEPPKPVMTDEELNRPEPESEPEPRPTPRARRTERRSATPRRSRSRER